MRDLTGRRVRSESGLTLAHGRTLYVSQLVATDEEPTKGGWWSVVLSVGSTSSTITMADVPPQDDFFDVLDAAARMLAGLNLDDDARRVREAVAEGRRDRGYYRGGDE